MGLFWDIIVFCHETSELYFIMMLDSYVELFIVCGLIKEKYLVLSRGSITGVRMFEKLGTCRTGVSTSTKSIDSTVLRISDTICIIKVQLAT